MRKMQMNRVKYIDSSKSEQTSILVNFVSFRIRIFKVAFRAEPFVSITAVRIKVWLFRARKARASHFQRSVLRVPDKLNASAFRSRASNEDDTHPTLPLPLATPVVTRWPLPPLMRPPFVLRDSGSFLWKFIEISNSTAVTARSR